MLDDITKAVLAREDIARYLHDEAKGAQARARIEGYLDEQKFTEGATVKTGDLLYVIEKAPYEAKVAAAEAAVAVAQALNESGLPTTLTLIGSQPPEGTVLPPFVRKTGFINKSDPAGLKQFNDLIAESHFLILPSRAEAFGIVFCEAASFGVPSLATRAGGIPTAVRDGGNGKTFPPGTPPAEYGAFIRQHFADYASYEALARSAFRESETRLNWGVSGATAMGHLRAMLAKRRGFPAAA